MHVQTQDNTLVGKTCAFFMYIDDNGGVMHVSYLLLIFQVGRETGSVMDASTRVET